MAKPIRASSPLADASALFQDGRFQEAHAVAARVARGRGPEALEAHVLAARVELRFGTLDAAVSRLGALGGEAAQGSTVLTLLGTALFRSGSRDRGIHSIEDGYRRAKTSAERAEAAYYRAWAAYSERHLDEADRWIATSLDEANDVLYARGLALSAWISAGRADYFGAARAFRLALGAIRASHERDQDLVGRILHELAVYSAELPDATLAAFVGSQLTQFTWPETSAHNHFQTYLHYGIALFAAGDVERALDVFDIAHSMVTDGQPVLVSHVELERADIFRILGEPTAARRAMRRAAEMLRKADWSHATIDDHMALLESCCAAARLDAATASEWLARYSGLAKKDEGWHTLANDRRVQANELHARGIVEVTLGNRTRGLARLRDALGIWESLGYHRRAAYALADLAAFGDISALPRLRDLLGRAPNHPLLNTVAQSTVTVPVAVPDTAAPDLPPAEKRVLDALCAGVSVREIAVQLDRSEFTIRNTLKRLFARFEVRSSAALVAKALKAPRAHATKPARQRRGERRG
jgi:DNA-binding CsgD family transcriptional regulator